VEVVNGRGMYGVCNPTHMFREKEADGTSYIQKRYM
jgi:hypothetical protein